MRELNHILVTLLVTISMKQRSFKVLEIKIICSSPVKALGVS